MRQDPVRKAVDLARPAARYLAATAVCVVLAGLSAPCAMAAHLRGPTSIEAEHREIIETLSKASQEGGELGMAARGLQAELLPHFAREEEIAAPPLSLLVALSKAPASRGMRDILPLTRALEQELPRMLAEHRRIGEARRRFESSARAAERHDYVEFAQKLAAHAAQEEEILYPAAILVGRYVSATAPDN